MWRRITVIVLWGGLIGYLLTVEGLSDRPRRPRPKDDAVLHASEPLAAASVRDPILRIRDGDDSGAGICSGTAFAIDDQGHWLTAHHVVLGCRQLAILTAPRHGVRVTELWSHPQADLTVLASGPSAPALHLSAEPLFRGEDGFHVGYPHGDAGDVHGALMGRVNLRRRRTTEPALLWAEIERSPDGDQPLGGLSGSPVVDHTGNVIGVSIGASPRRGRVVSAPPESVREVIAHAALAPPSEPDHDAELAGSNYAAFGRRLRERSTVAKVLCWDREAPARRLLR
jgi:S1-C subfamily serine protease